MGYEELAHLGMVEFHEASMRMGEERGEKRGEKRGERRGRQEGEKRGRQVGEQRGMLRAALKIARKLLPSHEVEQLKALPAEQALATLTKRLQAR